MAPPGTQCASDRLFVARDRTGVVRPITYSRLRRVLAAHPGVRVATAVGHADAVSTLTRVGRNLGLALAIVEVFGGDHPWLGELPDGRD